MKWWGWGEEQVAFHHEDKPKLAGFINKHVDIDVTASPVARIDLESLDLPVSRTDVAMKERLVECCGAANVVDTTLDRVVHAYGKSLRDLVRIRRNELGRPPDVIVYPSDEEQVTQIVRLAVSTNAVVIPFGGGTNISGSLEPSKDETRTVISLDLANMNKVIEIDETSRLARIQAGILGPDMEEQLNARGWTLGHFPDSFKHSTLGGWIATRSSGMQSDKYGDIADITRAVRAVTPRGVLHTRAVPVTSTGPSVREMILGSEGRLGVITEATVQVHRIPSERKILGYLFPDWTRALHAMQEISADPETTPSITRVSDAYETRFSFATGKAGSSTDRLKSRAMRTYLQKRRGFDIERMCLSFIGFEGTERLVKKQRKLVGNIASKHGGVCIGSGPGVLYDQKKFDTPYIRDFLLERGGIADVSETSTSWSKLEPLYSGVRSRAEKTFADLGVKGWLMCHMSHSYHSGACLYFTFAFKNAKDTDELMQYDAVKSAIQQAFIDFGGTLSHHHAVGTEHSRWLEDDISEPGVAMIQSVLRGIDPGHNLNPGKIVD